jgi:drug/metabolite transporter (DMT)-like permease
VADRGWLGAGLALAGAVMLFLGWYGVSGAATVGEQLPFVASGSIPGAALVVAAAVVLSRESAQRANRRTDALVAELHALLVEEVPPEPTAAVATVGPVLDELVALPGSERYHRADCLLVAGKADVEPVDGTAVAERHLSACDVCEPDRPAV